MKLRFTLLGLLSFIAMSCSYEESFVPEDDYDNSAVEFYATIDEQPDADTKVYADDQLRVLWNADDRITIFNKYTYGYEYYFKGEDGDTAGAFGKVPNDDFVSGNTLDMVYAVYPHSNETKIDNDGIITLTLPSEQTYKDSSFGIGANTMVSRTKDNQLRFKNVGGYLSFKFFGEGVSISSITLKGNNGELLAGKCSIDMSSGLPVLTMDEGKASETVTLTCDPAVQLGASSSDAVVCWFVLPPVTFTKGITVTVNTPAGGVFEKSTSSKLEISRSSITRMSVLKVEPEYPQPNNIIYYTSTDGEIVTPYHKDHFGANIVSNEYLVDLGVITFDGDVTSLGHGVFTNCSTLASISIPNSVTSIGDYAFNNCSNLASITIPDSVTGVLGEDAFYRCSNLTSVSFGNSTITSIGDGAFFGCWNLASVSLGSSITSIGRSAFNQCKNLVSITIPESVTSIGGNAFFQCTSLTSITLPNSITSIGASAFSQTNLTSVTLPESLTSIEGGLFDGCGHLSSITIPGSVTSIGGNAFTNCYSLSSIIIPESVTSIGGGTFWGCESLTSIIIPESVTSINTGRLFNGCYSLISVILPQSVTSIEQYAFENCRSLLSITIPESVTSIGRYAFSGCSSLTSITIPELVTSIGVYAFENCRRPTSITVKAVIPPTGGNNMFYVSPSGAFDTADTCPIYVPAESVNAYKNAEYWGDYKERIHADIPQPNNIIYYTSLNGVIVKPNHTDVFGANIVSNEYIDGRGVITFDRNVTSIGNHAFSECELTSIILPQSVTSIGEYAFENCRSLRSITIPESVTNIGDSSFYLCYELTSITLPKSIRIIGARAFYRCYSLSPIIIKAVSPPSGGSQMFWGADVRAIYVPAGSVDTYRSAQYWSEYADKIKSIE